MRSLEEAVAELPEPVALRYGTLYGPGTWYADDGYMANQARVQALVADASVTSFLHVDDAAGACCAALQWEPCTTNHYAHHALGWSPRYPRWEDGFRTGL